MEKFQRWKYLARFKPAHQLRKCSQLQTTQKTAPPAYPPIEDLSTEAKYDRTIEARRISIQNAGTVEEKLIKINMPRYYGWYAALLKASDKMPYNCFPYIQHCTRTHFVERDHFGLGKPENSEKNEVESVGDDQWFGLVKNEVLDVLRFEHSIKRDTDGLSKREKSRAHTSRIVEHLNRTILRLLRDKYPHLKEVQVDLDPRHEAYWLVGGMNVPKNVKKRRESIKHMKDFADKPVDCHVQYIGDPILALRSLDPLKPVTTEVNGKDLHVPYVPYNPKTIGFFLEHRHATNIPGFWPNDPNQFGILSYNSLDFLLDRPKSYGMDDNIEAIHAQASLASFAWLLAQACYQGFSPHNELTYPLVNQNIFTDGQNFSFYTYQLNTVVNYHKIDENPRRNILWGTKPLQLYESIDTKSVVNFNDSTLKMLLNMYANVPGKREYNMKPYLDEQAPLVASIKDPERRSWLERTFKHLVSGRPRHRLPYEVYHWEKIYKIDHKTRWFEARRRPFELPQCHPMMRRLDEHTPKYIPKALRPDRETQMKVKFKERRKFKWEKTFYP